jgi:hypothetical protein
MRAKQFAHRLIGDLAIVVVLLGVLAHVRTASGEDVWWDEWTHTDGPPIVRIDVLVVSLPDPGLAGVELVGEFSPPGASVVWQHGPPPPLAFDPEILMAIESHLDPPWQLSDLGVGYAIELPEFFPGQSCVVTAGAALPPVLLPCVATLLGGARAVITVGGDIVGLAGEFLGRVQRNVAFQPPEIREIYGLLTNWQSKLNADYAALNYDIDTHAQNMVDLYHGSASLLPTLGKWNLYLNKAAVGPEVQGYKDAPVIFNYFRYQFLPKKPRLKGYEQGLDKIHYMFSDDRSVASVNGLYTFEFLTEDPLKDHKARFTFVFRKTGVTWRIDQHHSSVNPEVIKELQEENQVFRQFLLWLWLYLEFSLPTLTLQFVDVFNGDDVNYTWLAELMGGTFSVEGHQHLIEEYEQIIGELIIDEYPNAVNEEDEAIGVPAG